MKIAIVGTGVSGLVTAHLLHDAHDLTIFEAADWIGGHTHTIPVEVEGQRYDVDTGFIVFNETNYPSFTRLLSKLGVASQPTSMSFSVHCERTGLEYNATSVNSLFAQRRNLVRPAFLRMVRDILRFHKVGAPTLEAGVDDSTTLGEFVEQGGYSRWFGEYFLYPMAAALWSSGIGDVREFPLRHFLEFFDNHRMLQVSGRPQWRTVRGGSSRYVDPLVAPFRDRIRLETPVDSIRRIEDGGVVIRTAAHGEERFDAVVLAAHSDQALAMLEDPSPAEREILGAIGYQRNDVVLHTDVSQLPRRPLARAAWNYTIPEDPTELASVTYGMSLLQSIEAPVEFCVTLNRTAHIDPSKILGRYDYAHPVFTRGAVAAQARRDEINGPRNTYYCGAYWGWGFHEDGVRSALEVARHFGRSLES